MNYVKNIVLVHSAFADGSSWSKVITLLLAEVNAVAVPNPLLSLAGEEAALAGTSVTFKVPVVVTTSASRVYSGPVLPPVQEVLLSKSIERLNMNFWEDDAIRNAITPNEPRASYRRRASDGSVCHFPRAFSGQRGF